MSRPARRRRDAIRCRTSRKVRYSYCIIRMCGVGVVVGALLATRVMPRLPFGTVIGLGPVTGFVAAGVMALTTVFPTPLLAGLSFFLLGAGPILWGVSTTH